MINISNHEDIEIEKILNKFSFPKDSIFFIHTDITNYRTQAKNWLEKCKSLYHFIDVHFKNHTVIVPTFTYSFCKNKTFDNLKSPSEVGIFTEYFRNQKKVIRSNHPIFSVAAKGKHAKILINNLSNSSTGDGSIFEKLKVFNAYIICFGSGFMESCTFLHYIEQCQRVHYRYSKFFSGKIIFQNKIIKDKWEFYVRNTELYKFKKWAKNPLILRDLRNKRLLIERKTAKFKISYCSAKEIFNFITKKLKKNENYIIGSKPSRL